MIYKNYQNSHGKLALETVTEFVNVNTLRVRDFPETCLFDLETAEKLALITRNKHIQICMDPETRRVGVIYHSAPDKAAICKIVNLDYTGNNATTELERCQKYFKH